MHSGDPRFADSRGVARRNRPSVASASGSPCHQRSFHKAFNHLLELAPPWLVSLALHLATMVLLAMLYLAPDAAPRLISLEVAQPDVVEVTDLAIELPRISADLAPNDRLGAIRLPSPAANSDATGLAPAPKLAVSPSPVPAVPAIALALTGRSTGAKRALLAAYGGTVETEAAVAAGLEWLRRQQRRGSWSLRRPYADGAPEENTTSATAMALMAFLGSGQTHQKGDYQKEVSGGIQVLLRLQDADGNFYRRGPTHHQLYSQAQATIAVCELFGMTQDPKLREPCQRAIAYAEQIQVVNEAGGGGWRYQPQSDIDTSVTGWFVMALQSARMAGLEVDPAVLDRVTIYLNQVESSDGGYRYKPQESRPTVSMTAESLLCRQYLGWKRDQPKMKLGTAMLLAEPMRWESRNVYSWYYATQVLHHLGGAEWETWNSTMKTLLPEHQVLEGRERGSWDPRGDTYGDRAGRLYTTCMSLFMLEVYYRHLPIYRRLE